MQNCEVCSKEFNGAFFNSVDKLHSTAVKCINYFNIADYQHVCLKCSNQNYVDAQSRLTDRKEVLTKIIATSIDGVQILTNHSPFDWQYQSIGIVTAQTTVGTGVITEFTSGLRDIVGMGSNRINSKLANAEEICFAQLRVKALLLGANAVIATDIDYGDIGIKSTLMICAAGTAVKVTNTEVLLQPEKIFDYKEATKELQVLSEFNFFS